MKRILSLLLVLLLAPLYGAGAQMTLGDLAREYQAVSIPDLSNLGGVTPEPKGKLVVSEDFTGECYTYTTSDGAGFQRQLEALLGDAFQGTDIDLEGSPARLYTHRTGARLLLATALIDGYAVLVLEDGYTYKTADPAPTGPSSIGSLIQSAQATPAPAGAASPLMQDGASFLLDGEAMVFEDEPYVGISSNVLIFRIRSKSSGEEISMRFPVGAKAGDVIDTAGCQRAERSDCWIWYESGGKDFYASNIGASSMNYRAIPEDSIFTIIIDEISKDGSTYSIRFEGVLVDYDTKEKRVVENGELRMMVPEDKRAELRAWSPTPQPTATPRPTPTPAPYASLVRGDTGDEVKQMQERLVELGYLTGKYKSFNEATEEAVKEFQRASGQRVTGIADSQMLNALYAGNAKRYAEPSVTLVFDEDANGQWKNRSGNMLDFRVQVKNISRERTIKAFELYYYTVDVYGDPLEEEGTYYYYTTTKKVKPGGTVYSEYVTLPYRSEIGSVYCGIKRVVYEDGDTESNATVNYYWWDIK